jgi:tRNA nucleotidyltransferase (CCA-adding enzyme)
VIKIRGTEIDISIPRQESARGLGEEGFRLHSEPTLSVEESLARRDFTINAMVYDPLTDQLTDPFDGQRDLRGKVLRHTSERFSEDPLRVLRAMQLAARLDFTVAADTIELCRALSMEGIARERVFEEWRKLIMQGVRPSRGLTFLKECGWVRYFPELEALIGCPQDSERHPEGDVWTHTLHCLDAFAMERVEDGWEDLVVGFAILCHDFGKPGTSEADRDQIRSIGHEEAGADLTRSFLTRMTDWRALAEEVVPLVVHHLKPLHFYKSHVGSAAIRRLARKVGRIDRLVRVARADQLGRPPLLSGDFPAGDWLLERAKALAVHDAKPVPLVMGRHLIELGLSPGPQFKAILDACYEAQIEGGLMTVEEGVEYARELIGTSEGTTQGP